MAESPVEPPARDTHSGLMRKSEGFNPVQMVRSAIQSSPWVAIAIAAHIVIFAILGLWKLGHDVAAEDTTVISAGISNKKSLEDELPPEPPPEEELDRTAIPENVEAELVSNEVAELLPQDAPIDPNRDLTQEVGDPNSLSDMNSDPTGGTSVGVGTGPGHRGSGTPSPYAGRNAGKGLRKGVPAGGPTQGTEEAVRRGLLWLVRHQNENGSWSPGNYREHCPNDKPCMSQAGEGEDAYLDKLDVGVTGLSLLSFLGAGFGHNAKQFVVDTFKGKRYELGKDVVLKGLKWLVSRQTADGAFSEPGAHFMYNEAIAALALSEAYGLTQNRVWKEPAQKAIDFLCAAQRPRPASEGTGKWGWRYLSTQEIEADAQKYSGDEKGFQAALTDSDISVTGWCVMALKSAEVSGLNVPQDSIEGALAFCKWVSAPNGLVGYLSKEGAGLEIIGPHDREFKYFTPSMASVAMCVRIFLEHNSEDPYLKLSADHIIKNLPSAGKDKDKSLIDYYYWYYGSLALNQLDGPDSPKKTNKYWGPWNKAMQEAVLSLQTNEEKQCATGGFLTPDRWCYGVGPVYTTAINVLTLEVYYRYENAFGAAQNRRMNKPKPKAGAVAEEKPGEDAAKKN